MKTGIHRLARNVSYSVLQRIWVAVLALVSTPIIYHGLGPDEYGLFAVVGVLSAQLFVLELGFGHATTRFVAAARARGDDATIRRVISTSLTVFLVGGLLGSLLILAGTDFLVASYFVIPEALHPLARRVLGLSALLFLLAFQLNLLGGVWAGVQQFGTLNAVSGVAGTVHVLGTVAIVLTGGGVDGVMVWGIVVAGSSLLAHHVLFHLREPSLRLRPGFDGPTFREMRNFGAILMAVGILSQLFISGGTLALGYFVAVGVLPFYSVSLTIHQKLSAMAGGMASALFPVVAEAAETGDEGRLTQIQVEGTRLLLLLAAPLAAGGVLLSRPFLTLWMGEEFASEATSVLQWIFLALGFGVVAVPGVELLRGGGRPILLLPYVGILALVNLVGVAVLVGPLGVTGAGVALAAAQLAGLLYLLVTSGALSALVRGLVVPLAAGFALGGMFWLVASGTEGFLARVLMAALLVGLYLGCCHRWVLRPTERYSLGRALRRGDPA